MWRAEANEDGSRWHAALGKTAGRRGWPFSLQRRRGSAIGSAPLRPVGLRYGKYERAATNVLELLAQSEKAGGGMLRRTARTPSRQAIEAGGQGHTRWGLTWARGSHSGTAETNAF